MIRLRAPQYLQLVGVGVLIGCAYGSMALIDSVQSLFVVSTLGALFYGPFLIVCNAACERSVPGDRLTEAITWMNAGSTCGMAFGPSLGGGDRLTEAITWMNAGSTCGMAFGPSLGGIVIDEMGAVASFDLGAVLALAIPVTLALFYRLLKRSIREDSYTEVLRKPAGKTGEE